MITLTSPNNVFSVTIQGDLASPTLVYLYTLSRNMLRIKRESTVQITVVQATYNGDGITVTQNFYTSPEGILEIPLKDVVNQYYKSGVTSVALTLNFNNIDGTMADGSLVIIFQPLKGISFNDMLAPIRKDLEGFTAAMSNAVVVPPNVICNPDAMGLLTAKGIILESNIQDTDLSAVWSYGVNGAFTTITPSGERSSQLEVPYGADTLKLDDGVAAREWKLEKSDACVDWVVVRWTSLTGATRQHYFPVVSFVDDTDKEVSVVEAGNGYDVRKNAYKGVKCRVCGLTSYGCWYYQDLLQASDVHAVIRPTYSVWETEISSMETACYVEGGMPTTPEGNGFFNFEFSLKLRHYDSV